MGVTGPYKYFTVKYFMDIGDQNQGRGTRENLSRISQGKRRM